MPSQQSSSLTESVPAKSGEQLTLWRRISCRLWGYDFFVSYHWASGGIYAAELVRILNERGYDCFLDRSEFAGGDDWLIEAQRALRQTQRLILIATREAITESPPVSREVRVFTERSRHVVPIVFGAAFTNSDREQYPILKMIPETQLYINELPENRLSSPSVTVVDQLIRTHALLRRRTIRARVVGVTFLVLVAATIVATLSYFRASLAQKAAVLAKRDADHELSNSHWQLAVVARDRDTDPIRATHELLFAARSAMQAGDQVGYRNMLLAADACTGHLRQTFNHREMLSGFALSLDRDQLLTWSQREGVVKLWTPPDHSPLQIFEHHDVGGAMFNADRSQLLTWSDRPREEVFKLGRQSVKLWDISQSKPVRVFDRQFGAVFAEHSGWVATWGDDSKVNIWDPKTEKPLWTLQHNGWVANAAFTASGDRLSTWGFNDPVRLWDLNSAAPLGVDLTADRGAGTVFSKNESQILAWGSDGTGAIWDVAKITKIRDLGHEMKIIGGTFNPEGSRVLTWSYDKTARLWDTTGGESLHTFHQNHTVNDAIFNHSGTRILTWAEDSEVVLFDASPPHHDLSHFAHGGNVRGAIFSPDDSLILSWNNDGVAKIWDATVDDINSQSVATVFLGDRFVNASDCAFTGDGSSIVASSGEKSLRLWNIRQAIAPHRVFEHGKGQLLGTRFVRGGTCVCTWSSTGQLTFWDVPRTGAARILQCEDNIANMELSPAGDYAVTIKRAKILGYDSSAALLNVAGTTAMFVNNLSHDDEIRGVEFSPDGSQLLTWSNDKTCKLWSSEHGALLWTFEYGEVIKKAKFSPDGVHILVWSDTGLLGSVWPSKATLLAIGQIEPVRDFEVAHGVGDAMFSSDGSHVLMSTGSQAIWWNVKQTKALQILEHELGLSIQPTHINKFCLLANPDQAIVSDDQGRTVLWDLSTGTALKTFLHGQQLQSTSGMGFTSSSDRSLFVGNGCLWDIYRSAPIRTFALRPAVRSAMFSHDCTELLMDQYNSAALWDLSIHNPLLDADERIRDFEIRSGSRLESSGELKLLYSSNDAEK